MRDALIFACAIGFAAGAEYDPTEVLRRATQKALASAKEIPNYTCVETVSRDYVEPAAVSLPRACSVLLEQRRHPTPDLVLRKYSADRLRLDVTMASKGEIYSWAGASRFDDADIDHVVRYGPIATGSFAGFLIAVFRTDVKKYTFERTLTANDRTLMEYSFGVAKSDSHYKMKLPDSWVYVPYKGTFQAKGDAAALCLPECRRSGEHDRICELPGISGLREHALTDASIEAAALYKTLRQLEQNGCVISEWDVTGNGPAKRVYCLTPHGEEHLVEWITVLDHVARSMTRFVRTAGKQSRDEAQHVLPTPVRRPGKRVVKTA